MIGDSWSWLTTAAHWSGADGIVTRIVEHLDYTVLTLVIAAVIALPIGAVIGHTGRGSGSVAGVANVLRALPSLGLLVIFALWALDHLPISVALQAASIAVLVLLAVPPILTSTYAGIAATDSAVRDAAAGMGMTGGQTLLRVEMPVALPLIFSGLRSAYLQTVATATIAAFVSLGGLGRYVLDGLAQHDYPKMVGGAVLVALLAIVGDRVIAVVAYLVMSPGITGRKGPYRRAASYPDSGPIAVPATGSGEELPAGRSTAGR